MLARLGVLALLFAAPAMAGEAHGVLHVTVRVVQHATVSVAPTVAPAEVKTVERRDGTEYVVPMKTSGRAGERAGAEVELRGCEGSAQWSGEKKGAIEVSDGERAEAKAFVRKGQSCQPVVMVTVLPDGAPPS